MSGFDFAVIGINHGHIDGQIEAMVEAGCRLKTFFAAEDDLAAAFAQKYGVPRAGDERAILEDEAVRLVVGAGIPCERGPMAVRAMRAGKDVMVDKPGCTTRAQLDELRRVQGETGRIFSICYSEHHRQRSTVEALRLVEAGAIGRVLNTVGLGPHRLSTPGGRPDWFWNIATNGPPLIDIASHQFEQFLAFTGTMDGRILSSAEANFDNPDRPEFLDYGHAVVATETGATGFIRVDWFTPEGAPVWGDGRLFLMGSEGTIELRKYMDTEGRPGADHLFLTDGKGTRYVDCSAVPLPYGPALRDDINNRTETAMPQARCFNAMALAITAHEKAEHLAGTRPAAAEGGR